jgi:parvulin-like peptidyl-prolyl isomerase
MKCLPLFCTALAFGIAAVSGCKKQDETKGNPNEVVASVDGVKYLRKDMDKIINTAIANGQADESIRPMAEQQLISRFINKTVVMNDAKKAGISVTDEDRRASRELIEQESGKALEEHFKESPIGEAAARKDYEDSLLIDKYIKEKFTNAIVVSDDEVEQILADLAQRNAQIEEANKAIPEKSAVLAKITDIKKQLDGGADFAELAKEHSACPSGKEKGGSLDSFQRGQMVAEFDKAAFEQEIGKVGDIVETRFGYHLILVTAKNPASEATADAPATPETVTASHILLSVETPNPVPPLPTVERVQEYLKSQKSQEPFNEHLKGLKDKAKITSIVQLPNG